MEIELKYRIPDDLVFSSLQILSSVGKFSVSTGQLITLYDTYYDTEESHLLAAGFALRERHSDNQSVLTLKSLTPAVENVHKREEYEIQATGMTIDQPDTWPDKAFIDRVVHITGGYELKPLFVLHQRRFVRNVNRNDQVIAEMCIDHMRCQSSDTEISYYGLEVELTESGTEQHLNKIRKKLEHDFDLIPEKRSKFEIALAFTQVPAVLLTDVRKSEVEPPGIDLDDSMMTAALKTFRYHFEVMKQNDAGTYRGEDIDYVHDMRVAVRRMRTASKVFAQYIDGDEMQPFLNDLKKTGKILGYVRDLDVFRENYEQYAAKNSVTIENSTLTSAWNSAYIVARDNLLAYLAGKRYLRFRESFDQYLDQVAARFPNKPSVADHLRKTLDEQRQQCFSYSQQISQLQPVPLYVYHQLRIHLKLFRYSIEYFRTLLGEAGEQTITATKVVQDHLGALQDAVVAQKCIRSVLQWGSWHAPKQPYTLIPAIHTPCADVENYLSTTEDAIGQLVETFPGVWERFNDFIAKQGDDLGLTQDHKNIQNTL